MLLYRRRMDNSQMAVATMRAVSQLASLTGRCQQVFNSYTTSPCSNLTPRAVQVRRIPLQRQVDRHCRLLHLQMQRGKFILKQINSQATISSYRPLSLSLQSAAHKRDCNCGRLFARRPRSSGKIHPGLQPQVARELQYRNQT